MSTDDFLSLARRKVADYFNSHRDLSKENGSVELCEKDIYIVWFCKTLQNHKALLATPVPDGMYYEITYNGDKNELYFDVYKKWENQKFVE